MPARARPLGDNGILFSSLYVAQMAGRCTDGRPAGTLAAQSVRGDTREDGMDGSIGDARDGSRWMLYSELAAARGISKASATRLVFRKHWPRRTGNDGQARVAVPLDAQGPSHDATHDSTPDAVHDARDGSTPGSHDTEALAREQQRADRAEARADCAEARADRVETREAELRAVVEQQGRELMAALLRTAIAETETKAAREAKEEAQRALTEARQPAWRRWLGL